MEVIIDIETQSTEDLKTVGARRYISHHSTRLMMLVAKSKTKMGSMIRVWTPHLSRGTIHELKNVNVLTVGESVPSWLQRMASNGWRWIGHNCYNFDAPFLKHHYSLDPKGGWYDTMHAARAAGLPGSLDAIGQALGVGGKHKDGTAVMRMLCQAKVTEARGIEYPAGTPPLWEKLLAYNIQDVELTEKIYDEVNGREEPEIVRIDRAINERGVWVDTQWLKDLLLLWDKLVEQGGDRLSRLTNGVLTAENAASVPKVRAWLASQGLSLTSLNRKNLEALYDAPEEYLGDCDDAALIVEVLKLRQSMTRAMRGKLATIAESLDDDKRVRDWSVYYGAHTGRFTSRRIQLHNMARGVPVDVETIINGPRTLEHVRQIAGNHDVDDVLSSLVRPVFCASPGSVLGIADYNAVEARGVAWLAGERWLLDAFNDPTRDVYCEFGSRIFGRPITKKDKTERAVAKVCVLGMGYGMGKQKFAVYAKQSGIDLEALGLTAEGLVKQYREACPAIVAMWRAVGNAAERAVKSGNSESACLGRVRFDTYGSPHLYLTLPSGRVVTYRHCRLERRVPAYCALYGLAPFEKDTLVYRTVRRYDATLFGAKLVENIVQAFCRDFLVDAMIRLGDRAVLHVHDELVAELDEEAKEQGLRYMCEAMSTPPAWASNFPLRVEAFTCPRYVKVPWSDSIKCEYMNGRKI